MSRKRNHSFAETSLSSDLHGAFMEPPGSASRADGDFLELEHDEELLCSVSDITEHLGRNITVVLETALSEIRKMVSIRIRVLKMELREKSEEIEALKARLDTVQRDGRDPFPGVATMEPSADAAFKKHDFSSANKHSSVDPRRVKVVMPGVKKENIDAICDYLMKDKNSRGCAEMDGDQSSQASGDREARPDPDPHSLNLWPDSSITGSGAGDSESTTDDLFSMLPSGSKRMYDYEWIAPMDYSSDLKVMKEPECDDPPTGETEDEQDEEEESSSEREGGGLEQTQTQLTHVQPSEFSMEPQSSPGEGGSPLEATADRPVAESDYELKGEEELDRQLGPTCQHLASASTVRRIKEEDAGDPSARPSYPESKVAVGSSKRRRCRVCGPRMDRKTQHTCIKCNKYICAAHTVKICHSCVV